MPSSFIEPCLPSPADRPPSGSNWIHEIKHDGYRLMVRRDPVGIQLITAGHDRLSEVRINRAATIRCHPRSAPTANEGARNGTDREDNNALPCSGCARSNGNVRELWTRGVRCD
jgi:hypothetical protein